MKERVKREYGGGEWRGRKEVVCGGRGWRKRMEERVKERVMLEDGGIGLR